MFYKFKIIVLIFVKTFIKLYQKINKFMISKKFKFCVAMFA